MTRRTGVLALLVALVSGVLGCAQHPSAPPLATPSQQAAIAETARLDARVEQLFGEGKFQEALPSAERSLVLRETTRGPRHPDVATSLNNLAALYQAQGAYAKAEPLLLRARNIREKALGTTHPDVAESLNNLAALYQAIGTYAKAEPLLVRALNILEKSPGTTHSGMAEVLNNLAALYHRQGAYAKAEPLLLRALDIVEKSRGATHLDVAEVLNNLATFYQIQAKYDKAEPLLLRALDIREKALGPLHPAVAASLQGLGMLYRAKGAYDKAEPFYLRALDIRERVLGARHPDVALTLNSLASLYDQQGAYTKVEPLYIRVLEIYETALGPMHPHVATSLNNLGLFYEGQGAYPKAEPLFLRALAILEKVLGPTHPDLATVLDNLYALYFDQGAYTKAEPLVVRAIDIHEKARGPAHPVVAISLNNLAEIYEIQGAYTKAEPLLVRALAIHEQVLGPMHPDVATSLYNLAKLYYAQGAYARAEPLYSRALTIREKVLGLMHPDVAKSLDSLAHCEQRQGAYAKAEPLLVQSLNIREKVLGVKHPVLAYSLQNLATLYYEQGTYTKAEPLYKRALVLRENVLGTMHPDVATTLNSLAMLYWTQGAYAKVEALAARASEIEEAQLRLELPRLSELRKRALLSLLREDTERVVSLHADAMPSSSQALTLALTTVLRRKGRVLDSLADNQLGLRDHLTPALRDKLDEFAGASTQLSTRLRAPFDPRGATSRASEISTLRTRVEELESALNRESAEFRAQSEAITVAQIQAMLPPGAALVEFVRYHRFDARAIDLEQKARYVAYVLPWQGFPRWAPLGEAMPIDAGVDAVLTAMHKGTTVDVAKAALQHLDTLVFAPLRGRLNNISHVILSPDDKLNLVSFEALVDPQGHYELEHRLMSYVTSGRDLLRLAARRDPRSSATIVAAPDYGPPSSPARNGLGTFPPLEGASAELAELPAYFVQPRTLTGDQATTAALSAIIGPAVVHIATHGFYAREAAAAPTPSGKPVGTIVVASASAPSPGLLGSRGIFLDGDVFASFPPPSSEDPTDSLDRAGLALAGANMRPDGIVSARELAGFDWWGTQLVVLSACETGVGAVPSGEGVYGMRRALVLAGAEAQVVSLWNVSDAATRELMRAFYAELARGTGRAEALRQAKLRLLHQPRFTHPYYWAAFIPAGAWTPLATHLLKRPEQHR